MATTTVQARTPGTVTSTAGTSLVVPNPSGAAVGDKALLWYVGGSGQPDATPSGWRLSASGNDGSVYWSLYVKKLVSGDVTAGSVTLTVTAAGKKCALMTALYSTAGEVAILRSAAVQESTTSATHAAAAVTSPGPGAGLSLLALKDTSAAASGTWTPPSGTAVAGSAAASGGSSQTVAAVAVNTGGDLAAGQWGTGTTWAVKAADGTTAVGSNHAAVVTLTAHAVLRPTGDVTVPAGTTYSGGSTITGVTADDDPSTYAEFGSGTVELAMTVGSVVPTAVQFDWDVSAPLTTSSLHYYAYLGATLLVDGDVDATVVTSGYQSTIDLSGLSDTQTAAILADPTSFHVRVVASVS